MLILFGEAKAMEQNVPGSSGMRRDGMSSPRLPTSLVIVAGLFMLGGVGAAIEVVVSAFHDRVSINFGVLGLFIGWGLLRLSRGWRTWALVFIWIVLVGAPLIALLFLVVDGPLAFEVFGEPAGHAPKMFGLGVGVLVFAVALWELRVLTRADVRRLFGVDGGSSHMAPGPVDSEP